MDRGSFLWLLVAAAITGFAAYNALFPLPPYIDFTRFLALSGFMLLCISLAMGPRALISPQVFAPLLAHRRAIGLASFVFVLAHVALSFAMGYNFDLNSVIAAPSGPFAIVAFVIFTLLAATSTDWAVKNLKDWKDIQRLAYVAFAFSLYHFLLKSNGLFLSLGSRTFVNLAESAMVLLGIATIALQAYGYFIVKRGQAAAKAAANARAVQAQQTQQPEAPKQEGK